MNFVAAVFLNPTFWLIAAAGGIVLAGAMWQSSRRAWQDGAAAQLELTTIPVVKYIMQTYNIEAEFTAEDGSVRKASAEELIAAIAKDQRIKAQLVAPATAMQEIPRD